MPHLDCGFFSSLQDHIASTKKNSKKDNKVENISTLQDPDPAELIC